MAAGGGKEMEIAIKIAGKVESSFKNALSQATKGLGTITKTVASATAAAAAAVGAMGVAAINTGREFEGAMSQVAATMLIDKTTAEGQKAFETLENAARECGASTAFSATEAAEALNYLALAGYDADKAATALPTVLKLAGAGAMDLAAASDMVTDSMSALGIEATEANLTQFSDQLAQTASKANTSVAQLGEAILTVGGTAKGLAGRTTELNTALGILADNGLKGAEGGTHLRNIILSLQNPTDKAAASLKSLGVDVYDSKGKMRGLNDVFKDLQGAMDGMNNAEMDSVLSTLFNKTDLTAANAMLANCTDRFDELSAAVENSAGACENMYAIQLDNLNGDIDILKSGLSDLGISVYKDLNGPLRETTQLATSMVGELSETYKSSGMEGMVGAVGGCMAEVVNTIADYAPNVVSMGVDLIGSFVQGMVDNTGPLADAAAQTLTVFTNGLFSLVPQVLIAGIDIITQLTRSITSQLPALANNGTQVITNFVTGIIQRLPTIISTALTLVQTVVNSLGANAPMLISAAIQLIGSLVTGILSMLPQLLQTGIQLILGLAQGLISNLPLILQMGVQIIISLVSGITQMLPMIIQGGIQLMISLIQGIVANLGNIVQAAVQIILALGTGLISGIPQLIAAVPQLVGAIINVFYETNWLDVGINIIKGIIDGIMSAGKSLLSALKSLFTGEEIDASDSSRAAVQSYAAGIEGSASSVAGAAALPNAAFQNIDHTPAITAGIGAGEAFHDGLSGSLRDKKIDTSSFNAEMAIAGAEGATALTNSFHSGIAASALDVASLTASANNITTSMSNAGVAGASAIGSGIASNVQAVATAATGLETEVNTALDNGWQKAETSAQTAMQSLTRTVTTAAQTAAQKVKAAFENMTITLPKPKLPVITVSSNSVSYGSGGSVDIPQFSVNWNALGGIFNKPTVFNTPSGMQGVGEAGAEAILPLDTLWSRMKDIVSQAVRENSGGSIIEALVAKLQSIGSSGGGGNPPELAGTGGITVQWSPIYNLYGSAGKEEIAEANSMSQAEFSKYMKQWQKDNQRKNL